MMIVADYGADARNGKKQCANNSTGLLPKQGARTVSQYLGSSEKAVNSLIALQTQTGMRARFGDPAKFPSVATELTSLHTRVGAYVGSVIALAQDATRTEGAKHAAAKELAQRATKAITDTAAALKARAVILQGEGQAKADCFFEPRSGYSHIESEVRTWLHEQVKSEAGLGKVLSLAKEDQTLASVIYHSPHYLTGLAPDLQARLRLDMTEHFVPEAFALVSESVEMEATAVRYDNAVHEVNSAFYTPALADKANTRVELVAV